MKRYSLSILTSIAIIIISLIPIPEVPEVEDIPLIDKWVHFVMYGVLSCMLWFDGFRTKKDKNLNYPILFQTTLYPAFLGGMLELAQEYLTAGIRSGDTEDFLANTIGIAIGFAIGYCLIRPSANKLDKKIRKRFNQKSKNKS